MTLREQDAVDVQDAAEEAARMLDAGGKAMKGVAGKAMKGVGGAMARPRAATSMLKAASLRTSSPAKK